MRRRISIFGSTGSIGCSTIDLIARDPDAYHTVAVTGGHNVARLADQAKRLRAEIAVTAHEENLRELRARLAGTGIDAAAGATAIEGPRRPAIG
ncbi:MAG: hypothetical protein R3D80_11230 [Paracoccaceae bacterium]